LIGLDEAQRGVEEHMKQLSALVVAGTVLAAAVSSPALGDENEIVIGAATSFSGWMAAFDVSPTHAAEIAVQDINAAGGVNGRNSS
jgi:branched-chain amino acid transport system substrate-binding protein